MESKGNEESVKAMTVIPAASPQVATLKVGNKSILKAHGQGVLIA